jgi:hypothetical protein
VHDEADVIVKAGVAVDPDFLEKERRSAGESAGSSLGSRRLA